MEATSTLAYETARYTHDREARWKALPLHAPDPGPRRELLPLAVVQSEWDQTLDRLKRMCTIIEHNALVNPLQFAYVCIRHHEGLDQDAIDHVLFDNLLLAMWSRTLTREGTLHIGGEWLWQRRKAVPFRVEKVGHVNRMVPWQPQHQWTYRFSLSEADV